jgi:hypothetical protein
MNDAEIGRDMAALTNAERLARAVLLEAGTCTGRQHDVFETERVLAKARAKR